MLTLMGLGLLVAPGCSGIANRVALKNCQFNVRNVQLGAVSPLEVNLTVTLGIYNPNNIEVIVDRFDYVVLINGQRVADGASARDLTIGVNQSGDLPISVRANVVDAAKVFVNLRRSRRRRVTVRGTYYVQVPWGRYPFPVEISHDF